MFNGQLTNLTKYGMVFLLVVTAILITELLHLALGFAPIITFVPVITFCVIWGGIKAGLFGLLLTVAAVNFFFIPPLHRLTLAGDDLVRLGVFGLVLLVGFYFRRHLMTGQHAQ